MKHLLPLFPLAALLASCSRPAEPVAPPAPPPLSPEVQQRAGEGVGCTLCHQIQPANLGTPASFTGHYEVGTNRLIYGPYEDVVTRPMQRHVNYTPVHGAHTQDSALCGTCHTLFTPILDAAGNVAGEFAEQTPYLEWRNSDHARAGRHCQDCHMPHVEQPVKVSSRPPWLEPRAPFWKHQFVGGNAFMLARHPNRPEPVQRAALKL